MGKDLWELFERYFPPNPDLISNQIEHAQDNTLDTPIGEELQKQISPLKAIYSIQFWNFRLFMAKLLPHNLEHLTATNHKIYNSLYWQEKIPGPVLSLVWT
jgi:hypothetical protein